jgi:hypothetical protein
MTARRSSGSASQAAAAFGRALQPQTRPPAAAPPASSGAGLSAPVEEPKRSKYTLLLDPEEAVSLDQLVLSARRQLGRRVDKSTLLRVLVTLAADDPALLAQVVGEIRRREAADGK